MDNINLSSTILSIALIAFVVIAAIFGAKKGFIKSIKGVVSSIIAVVLAVVCSSSLCSLVISSSSIDDKIDDKIQESIASSLPNAYVTVRFSDHDGDADTDPILVYETDSNLANFDTIFDDSVFGFVGLETMLENAVTSNLVNENGDIDENAEVVFIDAVSGSFTNVIVVIITFVLSIIIFKLIISLLLMLISSKLDEIKIFRFADMALGSILGAVVGALGLVVCVTILQLLAGFNVIDNLSQITQQSSVFQFIAERNIIYDYLASLLTI